MKQLYLVIVTFFYCALAFSNNALLPTGTITGGTTVCQNSTGNVIIFTGANGTAPYTFTYTITGTSGNQTISTIGGNSSVTLPIISANAGTFTYTLVSVHDATLPLIETPQSENEIVNIIGGFSVNAGTDIIICKGNSINLNSTATGNGSNAVNYSWNGPNSFISNQQSPNILNSTTTMSGNYTVTATIGNCQVQNVVNVIVSEPILSSGQLTGNQFAVCLTDNSNNGNVGFTISIPTYSSLISSYSIDWENDNVFDVSYNNTNWSNLILHNFLVGTSIFNIKLQFSNGCSSIKQYSVFVGSSPSPATMALFVNQADGCLPHTTQYTFNVPQTNVEGTTYIVSWGDVSPNETYTHPVTPAILTHIYNISSCGNNVILNNITYNNVFQPSVITQNPCSTPQPSASGLIRIGQGPTASFTPSNNTNIPIKTCTNQALQLNNTSNFGLIIPVASGATCSNTAPFYWTVSPSTPGLWSATGLGSNAGQNNQQFWTSGSLTPNIIFNVSGIYTITLRVKNNCGDNSVSQTFCVEPPITSAFNISSNSGCAPFNLTTSNTTSATNQCSTPTYNWNVSYSYTNCGNNSNFTYTNGTTSTSTNPSYNFIEAGTYTITLTASNSCSSSQSSSQTVTVKKPPIVSIAPINNSCGTATITPIATVPACVQPSNALTYAWSFPSGNPSTSTTLNPGTINYSTTGTYQVSLIVTNECGASNTATQSFTVNESPIITNTSLSQTICSGTQTALVNLTANPANATFIWTATATPTASVTGFDASGTNTIPVQTIITSGTTVGTVTYVIKPTIGSCDGSTVNYIVTVNPAPINTTPLVSSSVCQGTNPTILSVTLNNNSGNPSYQWYSNSVYNTTTGTILSGETNTTYNPPSSSIGTTYYYCVITLTSGGCSIIKSNIATVTIATSATITQPIASQNLCVGTTISSALSVTPSGGTGNPTYQWYNNSTSSNTGGTIISGATNSTYTPSIFNIAGSFYYYVIVNYTNGCGNLISNVAEILVLNDPTISSQPINSQTLCQGTNPINLQVILSGGSGTFSYQWFSNSSNNTTSGAPIPLATNNEYSPPTSIVGTKYYYCIITQNGISGCSVTSAISQVIITNAPTISASQQPLSSTKCLGQIPTQLSVSYSNGLGAPDYQWFSNTTNSNSGGTIINFANSSTYSPISNSIGTQYYYCQITFPALTGGCSIIVSNVAQITINQVPSISSQTTSICSNSTFTITPINSGSNIVPASTTYIWSTPTINPIGAITGSSSQNVPQNSISQTLINTTTSPATVTYTITPKSGNCIGTDFTVIITINPATNPNAVVTNSTCYGINNGNISTNITGGIPFSTNPPYTIIWTGPNSYTSNQSTISNLIPGLYTLSITDAGGCPISNNYTITEPLEMILTADVNNNITCFGSNNGAISISVTGGTGTYSYVWTKNGTNFATTEDINNLSPATYIVSVTDANNCPPKTLTFTITEPPILSVNLVSQTNVDCYGFATGTITINTTGGTPIQTSPGVFNYNYSWTGTNGYTSSSQNLNVLLAGTYNVVVTDNLGCTKNLSVTITQSTEIIITATTTPIECYGDNDATINTTISGGNAPYQIQWSNLAVGLNQNNLSPGNYTITITDNLGCIKSLTVNIPSPPIFDVNPVVTNISCFGANDGSIVLNFVGGIAPVNLVWSDGSPAGITRNNLSAGTYSVIITDSKPCTISRTFTIIEPQLLVLTANTTNALDCNNANSGSINLLVSGGTPPFNYVWNNGTTTEDLTNIPAGNYSVTVTDSRGCTKLSQYSITRPSPIVITVATTTVANCATNSVTQNFTAQVSGGVPPFQFNWSSGTVSGSNNEIMTTTQNGLVTLTATDAIGCSSNYSLNVLLPVLGNPTFTQNSIGFTSYGIYSILDPIQFNSTITGDYISVLWDFGDGTFSNELNPIHTYLIPNNYYLVTQTVTYPFGCVYVSNLALKVEKGYLLVMPTAFTPDNIDGVNDTLRPVSKGLKNIRLDIYDTWGSLLYSETGEVLIGWNGKIKDVNSENGNYYAKVSAETFYGTIINENQTFVLIK